MGCILHIYRWFLRGGLLLTLLICLSPLLGIDWRVHIGCENSGFCNALYYPKLIHYLLALAFFCLAVREKLRATQTTFNEMSTHLSEKMKFINSRKYKLFLMLTAAITILTASDFGATIFVFSIFSVIGWPVTFLMLVLPPVFGCALLIFVYYKILDNFYPKYAAWAIPLTILTLAFPPLLINASIEREVKKLNSTDKLITEEQTNIPETLAIAANFPGKAKCSDLCLRILLSGEIRQVIMLHTDYRTEKPDQASAGYKYWIEKKTACPAKDLDIRHGIVKIKGEKYNRNEMKAADIMQLKMATGTCLMSSSATASEADAVIANLNFKNQSYSNNAYSLTANNITANRLSYLTKAKNNQSSAFILNHQDTTVNYQKLWPMLAITFIYSNGMNFKTGLGRYRISTGNWSSTYDQKNLIDFLTDKLKLHLKLADIQKLSDSSDNAQSSPDAKPDNIGDVKDFLNGLLSSDDEISNVSQKVVTNFFINLNLAYAKSVTKEDAELALNILQDKRFIIPRHTAAPIRKYIKNDSKMAAAYAKALFDRLFDTNPNQKEDDPSYLGYPLGYLGDAIAELPNPSIIPYKVELQQLARNPEARVRAYRALRKLSVFGDAAISDLIYLIDNAPRSTKKSGGLSKEWQHTYLGGMLGLCDLQRVGSPAIPLIYDRLESGVIVTNGSYLALVIRTLIGMGAEPDEIWKHLPHDEKSLKREMFDQAVKAAKHRLSRADKNYCYF